MRIKSKIRFGVLGLFVLVMLATNMVFAQENVEGSKDHPLISRYTGSFITYYDLKEFDEYLLPLGKLKEGKLVKSQKLEGKLTRITYQAPEGRSSLEIYRNYELALKKAGFETLFAGVGEELGSGEGWVDKLFSGYDLYGGDEKQQRFLSAKLSCSEGDVFVVVCVAGGEGVETRAQVDVIEVKPMETGLVTVNAEVLAKDIARTGHVAVYGIYFDTGKADVKPESEPVLKEIAKLFQHNPKLNLYVVGHTDTVGALTANMELSQRRAEAVVKVLVSKYGVDAKRLKSYGVGSLSPVASNKTEEGRAKNRRVELVEQ